MRSLSEAILNRIGIGKFHPSFKEMHNLVENALIFDKYLPSNINLISSEIVKEIEKKHGIYNFDIWLQDVLCNFYSLTVSSPNQKETAAILESTIDKIMDKLGMEKPDIKSWFPEEEKKEESKPIYAELSKTREIFDQISKSNEKHNKLMDGLTFEQIVRILAIIEENEK